MAEDRQERLWLARARWRLRGAWQWPVFVVATLGGALLVHRLPFAGDGDLDVAAAFLICGFANLAIVAIIAPAVAAVWRRLRPQRADAAIRDRTATLLMGGLLVLLAGLGLAHRSEVTAAQDDLGAQLSAVRRYVHNQAPAYLPGLGAESTWKQNDTLYRTCVPSERPDRRPNSYVAGPDNPSRIGG
jgi:hypothetical protein